MASSETVMTLVKALHTNIDKIHATIESLSHHPTHEAELQRLATEREARIFDLRTAHAQALAVLANKRLREQHELDALRQREAEEIEEHRKREWEKVLKRRAIEDQEREKRIQTEEVEREKAKRKEDESREAEREERELSLAGDIEKELERVEDEIEARVEEGKKLLKELDEKRRAINMEIDKAINMPTVIPQIRYRSRTRTLSRAGIMEPVSMSPTTTETSGLRNEVEEIQALPDTPNSSQMAKISQRMVTSSNIRKNDSSRGIANDSNPVSPSSSNRTVSPRSVRFSTPIEKFPDLNDVNFEIEHTSPRTISPPAIDPMMRRLWTTRFEDLSPDPMMLRLWSNSSYRNHTSNVKPDVKTDTKKTTVEKISPDPMMRRLWTTKFEDLSPDPMMLKLWAYFPTEERIQNDRSKVQKEGGVKKIAVEDSSPDPMMRRLWTTKFEDLSPDPIMRRLWTTKFEDLSPDPMMLRLWANSTYQNRTSSDKSKAREQANTHISTTERINLDPMIQRLWTTKYEDLTPDPMMCRLWANSSYGDRVQSNKPKARGQVDTVTAKIEYTNPDPMIRRLWTTKYEDLTPDPMMCRLWANLSFTKVKPQSPNALSADPMMRRLWTTKYEDLTPDPMMCRLWANLSFAEKKPQPAVASNVDPMMRRLWTTKYEDLSPDPMICRLWANLSYSEKKSQPRNDLSVDPMMRRLWTTKFEDLSPDPMMCRLWADISYTAVKPQSAPTLSVDPMMRRLWTTKYEDLSPDPMMCRLWANISHSKSERQLANDLTDPMIRKLWAASLPSLKKSQSADVLSSGPMICKLGVNPSSTKNKSRPANDLSDPMIRRLWTTKYEDLTPDPMMCKLWAETNIPKKETRSASNPDPMIRRLWTTKYEDLSPDPMMRRLWEELSLVKIESRYVSNPDPMMRKLWVNSVYTGYDKQAPQVASQEDVLYEPQETAAIKGDSSPSTSPEFEFDHYGQRHFASPRNPSVPAVSQTRMQISSPDEGSSLEGVQIERAISQPHGQPWPLRDDENRTLHEQDLHNSQDDISDGSEYWSQSDNDNYSDHDSLDIQQQFGSLRPISMNRTSDEDEPPSRSSIDFTADGIESHENFSFEDRYGVPRPMTPIRSLSRIGRHPESPNTFQEADDVFNNGVNSGDESHSDYGPQDSYPHDLADQYIQQAEVPLEIVPEHETLNDFNDTYTSHRNSGIFANLVDSLRSDIPAAHHSQLDNHRPSLEYAVGNGTQSRAVSFEDDYPAYDAVESSYQQPRLHVRNHTADTVPPFETYAQSDSIPTTPSDRSSSPFVDTFQNEPMIKDAGRDRGMTTTSQPAHDLHVHTSKESDLDPAFANAYTSFVSTTPTFPPMSADDQDLDDRPSSGYSYLVHRLDWKRIEQKSHR